MNAPPPTLEIDVFAITNSNRGPNK